MHPVQAAPRQSSVAPGPPGGAGTDAPRAGSAEAKPGGSAGPTARSAMHPVQAAPRQSSAIIASCISFKDAPRAGSAEAKQSPLRSNSHRACRCTPCRQRRGKAVCPNAYAVQLRMHPVQAAQSKITTCRPVVKGPSGGIFSHSTPPESPRSRPHPPSLCTIQPPSF